MHATFVAFYRVSKAVEATRSRVKALSTVLALPVQALTVLA